MNDITKLTPTQCAVILALADNRMIPTAAAKKLCYHRNTILFHVDRIKKLTGKNPLNFYDLIELVQIVK